MKLLALLPAMALAACATTGGTSAPQTAFPAASEFDPIALSGRNFISPLAAAHFFARYAPETGEDSGDFELVSRGTQSLGVLEMVFSATGYADDSVDGEQWRILVTRDGANWRVIEAGKRVKCYRGANPGQWQKGLCV